MPWLHNHKNNFTDGLPWIDVKRHLMQKFLCFSKFDKRMEAFVQYCFILQVTSGLWTFKYSFPVSFRPHILNWNVCQNSDNDHRPYSLFCEQVIEIPFFIVVLYFVITVIFLKMSFFFCTRSFRRGERLHYGIKFFRHHIFSMSRFDSILQYGQTCNQIFTRYATYSIRACLTLIQTPLHKTSMILFKVS